MAGNPDLYDVDKFMKSSLVAWFKNCLHPLDLYSAENISYEDLVDGVLIHNVFRRMDIQVKDDDVEPSKGLDAACSRNLQKILGNIRHYYENVLRHVILNLPKVNRLAKDPRVHVNELEHLLLLLFGCALSCPNKTEFIRCIKQLDPHMQKGLLECTKKLLEMPELVLSPEMLLGGEQQESNVQRTLEYISRIQLERDAYREIARKKYDLTPRFNEDNEIELNDIQETLDCSAKFEEMQDLERRDRENRRAQLEMQARSQRLQIEEMADELLFYKSELEIRDKRVALLENENRALEVRLKRIYSDQMDEMREQAEKADRLERDVEIYKKKLEEFGTYKTRLTQLLEQNQTLLENNNIVNQHLNTNKISTEKIKRKLEDRINQLSQKNEELNKKNESMRHENQDLRKEIAQLECRIKASKSNNLENSISNQDDDCMPMNTSLSEQLHEKTQFDILKIQLQSQRLLYTIDYLQENSSNGNKSDMKKLEKAKEDLSVIISTLREHVEKVTGKKCDQKNTSEENSESQELQKLSSLYAQLKDEYASIVAEKTKLQTKLKNTEKQMLEYKQKLEKFMKSKISDDAIQSNPDESDDEGTFFVVDRKMVQDNEDSEDEQNVKETFMAFKTFFELLSQENIVSLSNGRITVNRSFKRKLSDKQHNLLNWEYLEREHDKLCQIARELKAKLLEAEKKISSQNIIVNRQKSTCQDTETTCRNLTNELDKLKLDFTELYKKCDSLSSSNERLKSRIERYSVVHANDQKEIEAKDKKLMSLYHKLSKYTARCETLDKHINDLNAEKKMLMDNNTSMLKQNQEIFVQWQNDIAHFQEQGIKSVERINTIERTKERLEAKIMEQFKMMSNSSAQKKKKNFVKDVKQTFNKIGRRSSELFWRNNRPGGPLETSLPTTLVTQEFEFCKTPKANANVDELPTRDNEASDNLVPIDYQNSYDRQTNSVPRRYGSESISAYFAVRNKAFWVDSLTGTAENSFASPEKQESTPVKHMDKSLDSLDSGERLYANLVISRGSDATGSNRRYTTSNLGCV